MRRVSMLFVSEVMLAAVTFFAVAVHAQGGGGAEAIENPVPSTAASVTAGAATYKKFCAFCHGVAAEGDGPLAPQGSDPPDLTDATWVHGSTDGEIFTVISDGLGGDSLMIPFEGKVPDEDLWNVVNYLRSLGPEGAAR